MSPDKNRIPPGAVHFVTVTLVLLALVSIYGQADPGVAALSTLLFAAVTALGTFYHRRLAGVVSVRAVLWVFAGAAATISLGTVMAVYAAVYSSGDIFLHDAALYLVAAAAWWAGVQVGEAEAERAAADPGVPTETPRPGETSQIREAGRITVRKGNSLHIVETRDILYISAMGDYVSIVTGSGRYVKEGTMVWFENVLADGFVRIHRSTIVNMAKISAVELYGKQSYNIKLCNGEALRASVAGYRLLREKLNK